MPTDDTPRRRGDAGTILLCVLFVALGVWMIAGTAGMSQLGAVFPRVIAGIMIASALGILGLRALGARRAAGRGGDRVDFRAGCCWPSRSSPGRADAAARLLHHLARGLPRGPRHRGIRPLDRQAHGGLRRRGARLDRRVSTCFSSRCCWCRCRGACCSDGPHRVIPGRSAAGAQGKGTQRKNVSPQALCCRRRGGSSPPMEAPSARRLFFRWVPFPGARFARSGRG